MLLTINYTFIFASHGFTLLVTGFNVSDFSDPKSKNSRLLNSANQKLNFNCKNGHSWKCSENCISYLILSPIDIELIWRDSQRYTTEKKTCSSI